MPPPATGFIVDLLGYLTGAVLYVMLVALVWRERAVEGAPFFSRRGRLPLLTGFCGLIWNVGALVSLAMQIAGDGRPAPVVVALTFSGLGFLPAVVVHSLLQGRETVAGRRLTRLVVVLAYGLSATAAIMHLAAAATGTGVPSRAALWLLTGGFTSVTAALLLLTRQQPIGRRGIWVAALSIFAVSALHFGRHVGNESWWVELIGHHASLPLALAILLQDYRFAFADLFLKNAIALLLLMGMSLALFSGAVVPLLGSQTPPATLDPRAIAIFVALWMATALVFPALRRVAIRVVDRVVLRRPDYDDTLSELGRALESVDAEDAVIAQLSMSLQAAFGASELRAIEDPWPDADRRVVVTGPELRTWLRDAATIGLLRLRTVEPPHPALALGPLAAGRRLLSDDVHLLEVISRMAARKIDSLRVTQERVARDLREQQMLRLATEAELRALRAQLNPHFLFNALTTIGHLIQSAPPRAIETLLQLTTVLRGVLRRSSAEFTTVGEEMDLVSSYLEIEHARFEERLRISVRVDDAARACVIPTLLLQPLVENAVKHGIAPRLTGGTVAVDVELRDRRLHVRVADSGVGFEPGAAPALSGVGLRSVAQRLRAHYGDLASLDIHTVPGQGTSIDIALPAHHVRPAVPHSRRKIG